MKKVFKYIRNSFKIKARTISSFNCCDSAKYNIQFRNLIL